MEKLEKRKVISALINTALVVVIIVISSFLYRNLTHMAIVVSGNSMYPTLKSEEYGYANKTKRAINNLSRFDIVIFAHEERELIKRVIVLPEETFKFSGENHDLYIKINDDFCKIEQDFIEEKVQAYTVTSSSKYQLDVEYTLSKFEYLVLGDNRSSSYDSRFIGPIKKEQIEAKLTMILGEYVWKNDKRRRKFTGIRFY